MKCIKLNNIQSILLLNSYSVVIRAGREASFDFHIFEEKPVMTNMMLITLS